MVRGVETPEQPWCVRQVVALRSDTLSGFVTPSRHRHSGNPEVVCRPVVWIVSVLKVSPMASVHHHRLRTDTFGLWHASGYQKRSTLRCCNAARRVPRTRGVNHLLLRMNHLATHTGWG
jgi:hypothetical protein